LLKTKKIFHDWMKKTNGHNWKEFEVDTLIAIFKKKGILTVFL